MSLGNTAPLNTRRKLNSHTFSGADDLQTKPNTKKSVPSKRKINTKAKKSKCKNPT
jgi:hypothetical protein